MAIEIRTRTSIITPLENHGKIYYISVLPGTEETLADAQEVVQALTRSRPGCHPILVDIRKMKSQSRDSRHYYASPEVAKAASAVALLVGSRTSMLLANFFMTVTKTSMPTQMFTDEASALTWLKGFDQ